MKTEYPEQKQIPELKILWSKCFPDPENFIDGFFETAYDPRQSCCITESDRVTAALYWMDAEYRGQKMAYIYAVATDPVYRGRGLCRSLMEDTHALLKTQGYAAALLLPGEPGLRRMYAGFGYGDQCEIRVFSCEPGEAVSVQEIGWREYAALRPGFLPENGAAQEGLRFLSTYAKFYRGEDFLLAAAKEGESLLGLELLGNAEAADGIVTALACRKGSFRTPGTGKQTVMALPLKMGVELPGYVGLTFD